MYKQIYFFWQFLRYITYGIREKSYNTGSEQGHINFLVYISIYVKVINIMVTNIKPFCFVIIMTAQEGAKIKMEGNPKQWPPGDPRQNSDGSSPTEVLETLRNLIVELQIFKADNEKLKKAQ